MKLAANIDGHYVAVTVPAGAYVDAAIAGDLAAMEVTIAGDLRIEEPPTGERRNMLHVSFANAAIAREIAVALCVKFGLPAFTASEWTVIADGLATAAAASADAAPNVARELRALADKITKAQATDA